MYPNNSLPNNQMPEPYPPPQAPHPPQQNDPYSFITNTPQAPNRPVLNPSSMKARIMIVAAGLVLLLIIVIVAVSFLGKAGKAQTERYVEIAKTQAEIIRVSTLAQEKTKGDDARALAITTKLAMTSAQTDTYTILGNNGVSKKALSKTLSANTNTKTDELLDEADKNNRYDETFTKIIFQQLDDYKKLLSDAYNGASPAVAAILKSQFDQANLIENKN